jgi:hypothetical protein
VIAERKCVISAVCGIGGKSVSDQRQLQSACWLRVDYARTTEKRMIAPSCQPEQSQNILQFRRDLKFAPKFAPKCAQCRLRMAIMRAEPDLKTPEFRITYRCLECGLLDRRTI